MRLLSAAGLRVLTARAPGAGFHHADLRIDNVMEVDGVTGCARGAERAPSAPPTPPCARAPRARTLAGAWLALQAGPLLARARAEVSSPPAARGRRPPRPGARGAGVLLMRVCAGRR